MLEFKMTFGTVAFFLLVFTSIAVITEAALGDDELQLDVSVESLSTFVRDDLRTKAYESCAGQFQGHGFFRRVNADERTTTNVKWIKVNIYEVAVYKCSLYFKDNSLNLLAFANITGIVHYMKGYDKLFEDNTDAIALPFGEVYDDLAENFGQEFVSEALQVVTLGKEVARMAANDIANFAIPFEKPPQVVLVKRALLIFKIMIAESLKSKEISARVIEHWNGCTRITRLEAQRSLQWNKLSEIFLNRDSDDSVDKYKDVMNALEVTTIDEIGDIVDFMVDERKANGLAHLLVVPTSARVQEIAHREQYFFWKSSRTNRMKQNLPHPLPKQIPTPAPAPVSAVGASAAAMPPMQFRGTPDTNNPNKRIGDKKRKMG